MHSASKNEVIPNWAVKIWDQSEKQTILCVWLCLFKLLSKKKRASLQASAMVLISVQFVHRGVQ